MFRKYVVPVIYAACVFAALTSCGGEKAGGTGEFATVQASAFAPAGPIKVDVVQWVDQAGAPATACADTSFPSIIADNATFTIVSTPYPPASTGQSNPTTPSPLKVTAATLTLTPANTASPTLPARFATQPVSAGQQILPGSTTISVQIASEELKKFFLTGLGPQSITCANNPIYSYYATVSFTAVEVNTNRESTMTTAPVIIDFSDFQDQ